MDRGFYFDRLYPLQDEILRLAFSEDTRFYLTGGTAASRGYQWGTRKGGRRIPRRSGARLMLGYPGGLGGRPMD